MTQEDLVNLTKGALAVARKASGGWHELDGPVVAMLVSKALGDTSVDEVRAALLAAAPK